MSGENSIDMKQEGNTDVGKGWIVVGSAFMVALLADGIKFSFGLMLPVLVDVFHESTASVAAIGGTFLGSVALSAPFGGSLSDAFGRRYVTIVGSLVFSCGLFCSSFAHSMAVLYFTYGILCGVGYGLMLTAPLACVMEHFAKLRSFAVGIAISGAGIGTFVMNQLTNLFIERYGWRGTFLLLSGITLNGVACGLALPHPGRRKKRKENKPNTRTEGHCNVSFDKSGVDEVDKSPANSFDKYCVDSDIASYSGSVIKAGDDSIYKSGVFSINTKYVGLKDSIGVSQTFEQNTDYADNNQNYIADKPILVLSGDLCVDHTYEHCPELNITDTNSGDSVDKSSVNSSQKRVRIHHLLCGIMFVNILTVLRDFECLCILLSCLSYGLGFFVPFSFLPKQALSMGIDSHQVTWLMSAIGIANTTFRLIFGWLGSKFYRKRGVMHGCILLLVSVALSTSVLLTTFETKLIFACVYGALFGSYNAIVPVRLASKVSVENVGKTTGLFLCMMNGASIVGTPLAGWTIDVTGDYYVCFLVAGAESLIAVWFVILPLLRKYCCQARYRIETTNL